MSRIEELERRVQQDPASIAFGALAEEYRRAGRLEDAVAVCRAGLERHPSYLSARVTLGRALQALDQVDDARAEFARVIEVAPDNLAAIRALAELHGDTQPAAPPPGPAAPVAPIAPPAATAAEPGTRTGTGTRTEPSEPMEPMEPVEPRELLALERWLAAIERARLDATERL